MTVSKPRLEQAKVLDGESILQDLDAVDLAIKIISDWIARRY